MLKKSEDKSSKESSRPDVARSALVLKKIKMNKRKLLSNFGKNTKQYKILDELITKRRWVDYKELLLVAEKNQFTSLLFENKEFFEKEKRNLKNIINNIRVITGLRIDNHQKRGYKIRLKSYPQK